MSALGRIMVVLEQEPWHGAALSRGVELARRSGAELHLYVFDHEPMVEAYGDDLEPGLRKAAIAQFIDSRLRRLAIEASALADKGLRVECDVLWAPRPHQAVIARSMELKPDLVIAPAGSGDEALRPLAWKLLRLLPADLMLVCGEAPLLPRRAVAAVDVCNSRLHPTPLNDALVGSALRLCRYADAELHLAHVVPFIPAGELVGHRLRSDYELRIAADLESFRSFAAQRHVPPDRLHTLSGDPASSLAAFIGRSDADLVALGSVYRSAWDRFMMGSTAEGLLAVLRCDVLMVKEPEFGSALARHADLARWQRALQPEA
ncbi:universal stress protein [Solimonas sp. SE-A11]|uniref:universal stress protein n=1 Tax=Solimonas sp. SE-A11 TaxID=3054954 RepID=UPI00259CAC52|nr:universal stress protein [Solimonas sp. SE-A11]MDM4769112.1 universal stress protein [Solimonas sp. SE-A11]